MPKLKHTLHWRICRGEKEKHFFENVFLPFESNDAAHAQQAAQ